MKKIYALLAAGVVLFAAAITFSVSANCYDSLFNANVEALADVESTMQIGCDNFSLTMICQRSCLCGQLYYTYTGYGHSTGLKGKCVCGRVWQ